VQAQAQRRDAWGLRWRCGELICCHVTGSVDMSVVTTVRPATCCMLRARAVRSRAVVERSASQRGLLVCRRRPAYGCRPSNTNGADLLKACRRSIRYGNLRSGGTLHQTHQSIARDAHLSRASAHAGTGRKVGMWTAVAGLLILLSVLRDTDVAIVLRAERQLNLSGRVIPVMLCSGPRNTPHLRRLLHQSPCLPRKGDHGRGSRLAPGGLLPREKTDRGPTSSVNS